MKTDDLIAMLATNVEPVGRRELGRTIGTSLLIAAGAALGVMLFAFGVRTDVGQMHAVGFLLLKVLFALGTVALASFYLLRLARPGGERRTSIVALVLPFVGIMLLAAVTLASAPMGYWNRMLVGDRWLECLLSIPVIAVVPFAVIIWAVRQMAPTDLTRTGALAGLVAGGVSAAGYALHCTDDSLPFIALWYGATIALCTLAGATLGPRLLRW